MESSILQNSKAHPTVIAAAKLLVDPIRNFIRKNATISAESVYMMSEGQRVLASVTATQKPAVIVLAFRAAGLIRTNDRVQNYEPSARYRKTFLWAAPAGVTL